MTEWHHNVCKPARGKHPFYLAHDCLWPPYMFENCIALDALEQVAPEWEMMGVGKYVHAAPGKQVNVDISIYEAPSSPNEQIPAPGGS